MQGLNVPIKRAAALMGISEQHLRIRLQRNRYDFGSAEILKENGSRYTYHINAKGFADYLGLTVEEVMIWQREDR